MSGTTVLCTIAAKNYLPHVRCLMDSVERHDPQYQRVLILVDEPEGYFDPASERFEVVASSELPIRASRWFHFKYTILELNTAVKPWALEMLLARPGVERVLYLDPDIRTYGSLEPLVEALEGGTMVLTPHLLHPIDDGRKPAEIDILRSGSYNLGFLGAARTPEAFRFLRWWQEHLYDDCAVDLTRGLFTDQRWMDLAPGLFDGVRIVRDPGYNVAYWNLKQRTVRASKTGYTAAGRPLRFFHFSGFDPEKPEKFSKHQDRLTLGDLGDGRGLTLEYARELMDRGYAGCKKWPYAYGTFRNGKSVPDMLRCIYWESPELASQVSDPFSEEGHRTFVEYWNRPVLDGNARLSPVTRLMHRIHSLRKDLQAAMPDILGAHQRHFLEWMVSSGSREHQLDEAFMEPVRKALQQFEQSSPTPATEAPAFAWWQSEAPDLPVPPADLERRLQEGTAGLKLPDSVCRLYAYREDLRPVFPDPVGKDSVRFLHWFVTSGPREYRIEQDLLDEARRQWLLATAALENPLQRLQFRLHLQAVRLASWMKNGSAAQLELLPPVVRPLPQTPAKLEAAPAAPAPPAAPFGANLVGYLHSETGVGESVRCAAQAAHAAGLPVSLHKVLIEDVHRKEDLRYQPHNTQPYFCNLFHVNADQASPVHGSLGAAFYSGRFNIGYWAWELEDFPEYWQDAFSYYSEIWCPSQFCQQAIAAASPVPVLVMPHSVRVEAPALLDRGSFGLPDGRFVFLTLFDMLSVFERKNPVAAANAFRKICADYPRAHLVVKINNGQHNPGRLRELRQALQGLPVTLIERTIGRAEVNALIRACDCLVSLHRSEGFGLTMAEAMVLGKPVIATGYSGNMDFMPPGASLLVEYRMISVGNNAAPYEPSARWANPDIDHAARQMRLLMGDLELRRRVAARGQETVRALLSPEAVGSRIQARLGHLYANRYGREARTKAAEPSEEHCRTAAAHANG